MAIAKKVQRIKTKYHHSHSLRYTMLELLGLLVLTVVLLVLRFHTGTVKLGIGDTVTSDITAPYTGTDTYLTEKKRQEARLKVASVYVADASLAAECKAGIEQWFSACSGWIADMVNVWEADAETLEGKYRYNPTPWKDMVPEDDMEKALRKRGISQELSTAVAYVILDTYMPTGKAHTIGEVPDLSDFETVLLDTVMPYLEEGLTETGLSAARTKAKAAMKKVTFKVAALKTELAANLIDRYMQVTVREDTQATEQARSAAAAEIPDVTVKRGETILAKGTVITAEELAHLEALGLTDSADTEKQYSFGALALYSTLVWLAAGGFLLLFEKRTIISIATMLRFTILHAVSLLLAFIFSFRRPEMAPVLFALLAFADTGDQQKAAGALVIESLLLPVLLNPDTPFGEASFTYAAAMLVGGTTVLGVMFIGKGVRRLLVAGIAGGLSMGLVCLCPLLWESAGAVSCVRGFGYPFIGGILAGILAGLARLARQKLEKGAVKQ